MNPAVTDPATPPPVPAASDAAPSGSAVPARSAVPGRSAEPARPGSGPSGAVLGSIRPVQVPADAASRPARPAPERPPVVRPNTAPVIVKMTPPFSVRLSQLCWILSFAVGSFAIVYLFVIRERQLPLISDVVRSVTDGRSDETYATASDIVFWSVFGILVALILTQVTLLVSFMSRRPRVRWWQLGTLLLQVVLTLLVSEVVAIGENGEPLFPLLAAQCGLVALALLVSVLPRAMQWSARRHDIRRGPESPAGSEF